MKKLVLIVLFAAVGCTAGPRPIEYGQVSCHSCSMTVVDRQHAAQLVTDKGKTYVFDAIECMVNDLNKNPNKDFAYISVNDYNRPAELIDAREATFLISPEIPSPMGAYLTAFSTRVEATKVMKDKGGEIFDWEALREYFRQRRNRVTPLDDSLE